MGKALGGGKLPGLVYVRNLPGGKAIEGTFQGEKSGGTWGGNFRGGTAQALFNYYGEYGALR